MASATNRALAQVAERQQRRRGFNQRLAGIEAPDHEPTPFRCECGLIACGATIKLSGEEYADLRSDPRHFAMLAEHVISGADRIVARHRGWVVVEQPEEVATAVPPVFPQSLQVH
ncbi:MAG TPA: hypothetical protein VFZ00_12020 [Solirubrobacter sp.]|jgi:hypothetical protein|nr:hypothetical protein [Solirubrobacter sp.]